MSDQVKIKAGVDSSAIKTGLAQIKNQFAGLRASAGGALAGAFAVGGIGAGIGALIEKASKLNDLAGQFGIVASELQRIGNAATQNGSSVEAVGASLNKLALSQEKVRAGSPEAAKALETLGIKAEDFINLAPHEAFYAVADAMAGAKDRGAAYAAVIALMGKSSGELVSTMEMGSEAIKQMGDGVGVFSDDAIAMLDDWGIRWTKRKAASPSLARKSSSSSTALGNPSAQLPGRGLDSGKICLAQTPIFPT